MAVKVVLGNEVTDRIAFSQARLVAFLPSWGSFPFQLIQHAFIAFRIVKPFKLNLYQEILDCFPHFK
jgi:hypothetical protein